MKRYIYIIIGIIVAATLVIFVLFYIKNRAASPVITTGNTGTLPAAGSQGGNTPVTSTNNGTGNTGTGGSSATNIGGTGIQAGVQSFGVISNDPVLNYFVDAQNNIVAIQPTGAIIKISGSQSTVINSSTISNIISAAFSYDGKKILVNFGDPASPQSSIFDIATNLWISLPQGLHSPQWSPSNYQVAYLSTTNSGKLSLSIIDGSSASTLKRGSASSLSLNASDLTLQWPSKSQFIISDKPTLDNAGSIWLFNSQTGSLTAIAYEAAGAESQWSKSTSTSYGLIFLPQSSRSTLQLATLPAGIENKLLTFATLPSKCLFNTEIATTSIPIATTTKSLATSTIKSAPYMALYCGIPRSSSGFATARIPDDYNMMALFTSDDISKINAVTGQIQTIWNDSTQNVDVSDMKYFNNVLFFVNRYDQKLYGLTFTPATQ
jgi:hypothetical protein